MGCGGSKEAIPEKEGATTKRTAATVKEQQQKQTLSDSNDTAASETSTANNGSAGGAQGADAETQAKQTSAAADGGYVDPTAGAGPVAAGGAAGGALTAPGGQQQDAASKQEIKMLLLGSGESGKSTIIKQIKIIHQNGFSEKELRDLRPFVYKNVLDCAISVVKALREFDLVGELDELDDADLEFIANATVPLEASEHIDQEAAAKVIALCKEPVIDKLIAEHRNDFYLMDSAKYFFEHVERICDPGYLPSVTDALRTRKQTSGIFETVFYMGNLRIHMFDVGGQRSERKKWIHCFDNVTLIMFCVALSEYDQVLLEESTQNRLEESLKLFDSVVNSRWFTRTSVVLFLNKIDVFAEKLSSSPLEKFFPDYTGGSDINKAAKYILWRFTQLNRAQLNIYPHVTQAIDTSNIKLVFVAVKETILENSLRDTGIL